MNNRIVNANFALLYKVDAAIKSYGLCSSIDMSQTILDRSIAPPIQKIKTVRLPELAHFTLDNGLLVNILDRGTQEVLKLDVVFHAGRPFEQKPLTSRATIGLLKEGTKQHTSAQIAEIMDFYGASLSNPFSLDTSSLILYSLNKHFETLLPLFTEIIAEPIFPEKELQNFVQRSQQRLKVDLSKADVVAYRQITEYIFGAQHPYGYNSNAQSYAKLQQADLYTHFNQNFRCQDCTIFISGKLPENIQQLLNQYLGQLTLNPKKDKPKLPEITNQPSQTKIPLEGVQSAIRVGKRMPNRKHPDYPGLFILNAILGGYFGSRLMANIREEKGYTYNIYSTLDPMMYDGYFYIGTEVGNEFVGATLKEIYHELKVLQEERITPEELDMVKNYLMGTLLMSLDGAFNAMEVWKALLVEGLDKDYFDNLITIIQDITAEELQTLAQKYFQLDSFWEVIVGA
ncbi:MAG: pitrilysin family protein [Bacteroidota bacterium]